MSEYIHKYRGPAQRACRYYSMQRNLPDAIQVAALSKLPGGGRHPHQRRIPGRVLQQAASALAAANLSVATFDELHEAIRNTLAPIRGIGDLAIYDIADRIGAYFGLEPNLVYLHAGTREGARVLGFWGRTLLKTDLPKAFHRLKPGEIEDCLCIYKADLRRLAAGRVSRRGRSRVRLA